MADIATQNVTRAGLKYTSGALANGDKFVPGKDVFLLLTNGAGVTRNVTVVTPAVESATGLAIADQAIALAASDVKIAGPFPAELFADPADSNKCVINVDGASVTVAVLKVAA